MTNLPIDLFFILNSLTVLIICVSASVFFSYLLKNSNKDQKTSVRYFMLHFVLVSLGLIATFVRTLDFQSFSILTNNILYIIATYAAWHGIAYRNGYQKQMLTNQWMYANVVFIIIVNYFVFHLWHDNTPARIIILHSNIALVTLSHLFISFKNFTTVTKPADVLLRFMIIFLPTVNLSIVSLMLISKFDLYFIVLMGFQLVQGFMMAVSIILILMLDIAERHYHDSIIDNLSGLYNRRFVEEKVSEIVQDLNPNQPSCCALIICDLDDFKKINDNYGHHVGDLIIQKTSDCIRQIFAKDFIYGRYGGEEFVMFSANQTQEEVLQLAEEFRALVAHTIIDCEGVQVQATISVGVTFMNVDNISQQLHRLNNSSSIISNTNNVSNTDINTVSKANTVCSGAIPLGKQLIHHYLKRADKALYQAKETGKNKVCVVS